MRGCEDELRGGAAIGERGFQLRGDREGRGDSGDNLERNAELRSERSISSLARPKTSGSPDFSRSTRPPCAGVFQHQRMDAGLGDARLSAALANRYNQRRRAWPAREPRRRPGRRAGLHRWSAAGEPHAASAVPGRRDRLRPGTRRPAALRIVPRRSRLALGRSTACGQGIGEPHVRRASVREGQPS